MTGWCQASLVMAASIFVKTPCEGDYQPGLKSDSHAREIEAISRFSKVDRGKAKINKKSRLFHVFASSTKLAKKGQK